MVWVKMWVNCLTHTLTHTGNKLYPGPVKIYAQIYLQAPAE